MGCRGNIEICQRDPGPLSDGVLETSIFFYTHWTGDSVCQDLAQALDDGRSRWNDPDYLTRIIFNQLQGDNRDLTGFGIGLRAAADAEFPIPKLYWTTITGKFAMEPDKPMVEYETDVYTANEFIEAFLPAVEQALEPTLEIKGLV
jgi:hypothetical protein